MDIADATFVAQTIILDHHNFVGCAFLDCRLVYMGHGEVGFGPACVFERCTWALEGPALNAIDFLTARYRAGEVGRAWVEDWMRVIQTPESL